MNDDLELRRAAEREKYEKIYSGEAGERMHRTYGHSNHGRDAWPIVWRLRPQSLVDVGTGHGEFPRMAKRNGIGSVYGFDFALPVGAGCADPGLTIAEAPAHMLPIRRHRIDMLTSFDMLEHLLKEEVPQVLQEFDRVTKRWMIFSISHRQSFNKVDGKSLHMCVKPPEWWEDQIRMHTRFDNIKREGHYWVIS